MHCSPAGRPFPAQLLPCQAWRSCPHMVIQHSCNSTVLLPWLCDAALIQQLWREPGQGQCVPPPPSIHLYSTCVCVCRVHSALAFTQLTGLSARLELLRVAVCVSCACLPHDESLLCEYPGLSCAAGSQKLQCCCVRLVLRVQRLLLQWGHQWSGSLHTDGE